MGEQENKQVYVRFVEEVINGGNTDLVPELFSEDYFDHSRPPGAPEGLEGVKAIPRMFRGAFPDVHFTIEEMVAEGDIVATRVIGRGTQQGEFVGFPASGKRAAWASHGFFRVEDGKIAEHWGVPDLLHLMQQIGAVPGGDPDAPEPYPMGKGPETDGTPLAEKPYDEADSKAIMRHHVGDLFNQHDLSSLDELLGPDYVYHVLGQDIRGFEGYKQTVYPLFDAFPDVQNTIKQIVAEGDRVAVLWQAHGTHTNEFFGMPPTGVNVEVNGITFERIRGSKRLEGWGVPDMLGLMNQIRSAMPEPAPA
jgi:steroid delta-isomerase-like uncharacterized protein